MVILFYWNLEVLVHNVHLDPAEARVLLLPRLRQSLRLWGKCRQVCTATWVWPHLHLPFLLFGLQLCISGSFGLNCLTQSKAKRDWTKQEERRRICTVQCTLQQEGCSYCTETHITKSCLTSKHWNRVDLTSARRLVASGLVIHSSMIPAYAYHIDSGLNIVTSQSCN